MTNQIRDAILRKCNKEYVRWKLLEEARGLTLALSLELSAQCERTEAQMSAMHASTDAKYNETVHRASLKGRQNAEGQDQSEKVCYRCGHFTFI